MIVIPSDHQLQLSIFSKKCSQSSSSIIGTKWKAGSTLLIIFNSDGLELYLISYNFRWYRFDRKHYFLSSLISHFSAKKNIPFVSYLSLSRTDNQDPWLVYHFFQELNCSNYICTITLPFWFLSSSTELFPVTLIHLIHRAWLD